MGWTVLLILAVVQGATEFLPVSSSAHLVFARALVRDPAVGTNLVVEVALHLGTLVAVAAYFRADLLSLARGALRPGRGGPRIAGRERALLAYLAVGTLPAAVAGLAAKDAVTEAFARPRLAGAFLLLTASGLAATRWLRGGGLTEDRLGAGRALLVGAAQALALLPGVSRSGATLVAGLAVGLEAEAAFRFSFLLSIPAVLGAALLQGRDVLAGEVTFEGNALALAASVALACVIGYLSLHLLRRLVARRRLHGFALYCAVVGAVALALGRDA